MASYTIPESVIGVPLFVPDGNDRFSIEAGGLPNGDDCLKIAGNLGADYKAFMSAPEITPNIFRQTYSYTDTTKTASIVFWAKFTSFAGMVAPNNHRPDQTLIQCATGDWAPTADGNPSTGAVLWNIEAAPTHITVARPVGEPTTNDYHGCFSDTVTTGDWHMFTVVLGYNESSGSLSWRSTEIYIDDNVSNTSTMNYETSTSGNLNLSNAKFCIGSYSDQGDCQSAAIEWYLGKFSVHAGYLNPTERALLYNAMTA